jgi:transposase
MEPIIPPWKNRKAKRYCDYGIYRLRCLIENAFLRLKQWRGVVAPYAKTSKAFVGAVTVPVGHGACLIFAPHHQFRFFLQET